MDTYLRREKIFTRIFLLIVSVMVAHTIRHQWIVMCGGFCAVNLAPPQVRTVPEAYRIALPAIDRVINILFQLKDGTLAGASIDLISCFLALNILCYLAMDGIGITRNMITARVATLAIFLAFIQFPISFIYFLQRPETLPATLFIALALLCMTKAKTGIVWVAFLFLATACQAFVRSDVPFILGIAVVMLTCSGNLLRDFGTRKFNFFLGAGMTLIAGGIQAYMQFIEFAHLPYSTGSPIMIMMNIRWNVLDEFLLAILPFVLLLLPIMKRRKRLTSVEVTIIAASALYFPLWFTVGIVSEIRIFVPFMLGLCVVAARVLASYLFQDTLSCSADIQ